ncbi:MAG: hypothetical protein AAFX87_30610 [Bacteroidota bacterium]
MYRCFYTLALSLFTCLLHAQGDPCTKLAIDQSYYYAGDTIKGVVFTRPCVGHGINYLALFDENKQRITEPILFDYTESTKAFYLKLPSGLADGIYYLTEYGNYDQQSQIKWLQIVPIFGSNTVDESFSDCTGSSVNNDKVVTTSSKSYKAGQEVEIDLAPLPSEANYYLSITDQDQLSCDRLNKANQKLSEYYKKIQGRIRAEPESFRSISGNVKVDGEVCVNCDIVLSVPNAKQGLQLDRTDQNGYFFFDVIGVDGDQKAFLVTDKIGDLTISYERKEQEMIFPEMSLSYSDLLCECAKPISLFKKASQIDLAYAKLTADEEPAVDTLKLENVYDNVANVPYFDKEVLLNDYINFRSFKQVVKEVVPYVNFIKKNQLRVFSPDFRRNFADRPYVLIDGIPISNDSLIYDLNPAIIYKIRVIYKLKNIYNYGEMARNGMIAIYTKNGFDISDLEIPNMLEVPLKGYANALEANLSLDGSQDFNQSEPMLDPLVFRDYIKVPANSKHTIRFKAPNNPSSFKIAIYGVANGQFITKEEGFVVKP